MAVAAVMGPQMPPEQMPNIEVRTIAARKIEGQPACQKVDVSQCALSIFSTCCSLTALLQEGLHRDFSRQSFPLGLRISQHVTGCGAKAVRSLA